LSFSQKLKILVKKSKETIFQMKIFLRRKPKRKFKSIKKTEFKSLIEIKFDLIMKPKKTNDRGSDSLAGDGDPTPPNQIAKMNKTPPIVTPPKKTNDRGSDSLAGDGDPTPPNQIATMNKTPPIVTPQKKRKPKG
jgi:hypothetical protein